MRFFRFEFLAKFSFVFPSALFLINFFLESTEWTIFRDVHRRFFPTPPSFAPLYSPPTPLKFSLPQVPRDRKFHLSASLSPSKVPALPPEGSEGSFFFHSTVLFSLTPPPLPTTRHCQAPPPQKSHPQHPHLLSQIELHGKFLHQPMKVSFQFPHSRSP